VPRRRLPFLEASPGIPAGRTTLVEANTIKALRIARGQSQEQAAGGAGVNVVSWGRFERGLSPLTPAMARRIASYFGVAVDDLIAAQARLHAEQRRQLQAAAGAGAGR
jgi:transcriptional regulator with XRE-family HTH domain